MIAELLSNDLKSCHDWLVDNKLSLHLGKTECILFSTKRKIKLDNNFKVFYNSTQIKQVKNVSYLGLSLDDTLSGESIITNIIKKASSRLKFLYRYKFILKKKQENIIFCTYSMSF